MDVRYSDRIGQTIRGCLILNCFKKENKVNPYYTVKCKCDKEFVISAITLCNKAYKDVESNCGCIKRNTNNGKANKVIPENNIGKIIRNVKILRYLPNMENLKLKSSGKYECLCECGNNFIISHTHLFKKQFSKTRANCGCFREDPKEHKREYNDATYQRQFTHKLYCSKKRNLEFSLSKEQFIEISKKPCYYCNEITTRNSYIKTGKYYDNSLSIEENRILTNIRGDRLNKVDKYTVLCSGIDRYDNTKGYTLENSVPCCRYCNTLKSTKTIDRFYKRMEKLSYTNPHCRKILEIKKLREEGKL